MKVKFLKRCKYSEDGLHVKSVEKGQEAELTNEERAKALCKSGFCVESKEPKIETKEEPEKPKSKKQAKREAKEKAKVEDDDFLS